ncbi:MAG TPA: hypothetical protein VMK12_22080 [Anaeromyxobacteraceae bacterium]|nr:hypothetical protein [Anaeromyxobacteraceae bacterium]
MVVTGGEPFCRLNLDELLAGLQKNRLPWAMVTNGWALSEANVDGAVGHAGGALWLGRERHAFGSAGVCALRVISQEYGLFVRFVAAEPKLGPPRIRADRTGQRARTKVLGAAGCSSASCGRGDISSFLQGALPKPRRRGAVLAQDNASHHKEAACGRGSG